MGRSSARLSLIKKEAGWSYALPFAFLLSQYGYGLGGLMLTYCLFFSAFCVVKHSDFPVFKPLAIYTVWYVAVLLCTVVVFGHPATKVFIIKLIRILIIGYSVTIIAKYLDVDKLYKCWKILGLIVCVVVAFQFFRIFILHQYVLPIRLLPVRGEDLMLNDNWTTPSDRPVAFFTEPAMVVAFLTPVLFFAQQKKDLLVAIIVSIAILLTGSSSGVIALVILWGVPIVSKKMSVTMRIIMLTLFFAVICVFMSSSLFSASIEKIAYELSGESGNMAVRVLRGWWVYGALDVRSQLLGISDYDISSFVYRNASEFTLQTRIEDNFYLNTIQRILIQTGAVGAVIYIWMLFKLWISTSQNVKPYLMVVIVSMFYASNFYINGLFVMQFIIILSYLRRFSSNSISNRKA